MKVTVQYVAEHLDEVIAAADCGEPVEIQRVGKPALLLVRRQRLRQEPRILGAGRGELRVPSFEEWQAMDAAARA